MSGKNIAVLAAVFLMLLLPVAFSQQPVQPQPTTQPSAPTAPVGAPGLTKILSQFYDDVKDWLGLTSTCGPTTTYDMYAPAMLALLAIIFAITIVYLAGQALSAPMLITLAKQEGYEALLTVMIAIAFITVSGAIDSVVLGSGAGDGLFDRSMEYSNTMIFKLSGDVGALLVMNTMLYMLSSTTFRLGGPLYQAVRYNLGPILKPFIDLFGVAGNMLSIALGAWLANLNLLCFIKEIVMPLFFPLGLLMRVFPQLRGGGNTLIAFSFALYVIYPLMLSINYDIYIWGYGSGYPSGSTPLTSLANNLLFDVGLGGIALYAAAVYFVTGGALATVLYSYLGVATIALVKDLTYTVFILSIFMPLMNIFITLTFARELAKFMGTEINVSAFVQLI